MHGHPPVRVVRGAGPRCSTAPCSIRTPAGGLGLVHTVVPAADVDRFRPDEVDSVVDTVRTAAEAEVAAVLKQVGPQRWSMSLRSKGTVDVVAGGAARLGGGGHRAAAGFTLEGTVGQVLSEVRSAPLRSGRSPLGLGGSIVIPQVR